MAAVQCRRVCCRSLGCCDWRMLRHVKHAVHPMLDMPANTCVYASRQVEGVRIASPGCAGKGRFVQSMPRDPLKHACCCLACCFSLAVGGASHVSLPILQTV
jgi:hypothetical protein